MPELTLRLRVAGQGDVQAAIQSLGVQRWVGAQEEDSLPLRGKWAPNHAYCELPNCKLQEFPFDA
jgi:hypothetical protein